MVCPSIGSFSLEHGRWRIVNGSHYEYRTKIIFTCDPGYYRLGPAHIQCMANGAWSWRNERPHCQSKCVIQLQSTSCLAQMFKPSLFVFPLQSSRVGIWPRLPVARKLELRPPLGPQPYLHVTMGICWWDLLWESVYLPVCGVERRRAAWVMWCTFTAAVHICCFRHVCLAVAQLEF